jgi:hypothetical protein
MGTLIVLAIIFVTGPAALLFGADSRRYDDRSW